MVCPLLSSFASSSLCCRRCGISHFEFASGGFSLFPLYLSKALCKRSLVEAVMAYLTRVLLMATARKLASAGLPVLLSTKPTTFCTSLMN
jgi:hypothetical protein